VDPVSKLANPYRCNLCGKLRENDANHWLLLFGRYPVSQDDGKPFVVLIETWTERRARGATAEHACGLECALKLAERWLTTHSFDPASSRPVAREQVVGAPLAAPAPSVPTREEGSDV